MEMMDKLEQARKMFQELEGNGQGQAAEVAMRTFQIRERLAEIRA